MLGLLFLFAIAYGLLIFVGVFTILWQMNRPRRKTMGVALAMGGVVEPADLGLEAEAVTFNLADGSASPGWIITGDAPAGPTVVVVHGHRDSRFGSLYRAEMLRRYARTVVVFDLPGHGDAAARTCGMGQREMADVRAVVSGLPVEQAEARAVVLLGYSMGAVIAIQTAAAYPELISAVTPEGDCENMAGDEGECGDGNGSEASGGVGGVIACAPYRWWDEGLRGQLARRKLPAWPMVPLVGFVLRLAGGRLGAAPGFDLAAEAATIDRPLLVLHGDADTVCPLSAGRAVAEAAPRGELAVIEGGTHNQLLGADYEAVHAALAGFFKKLGKPA